MLKNREKRAFWLFIVWVAALPLMFQPDLAAQNDDDFIIDNEVTEEPAEAAAAPNTGTGSETEAASVEPASGSADPAAGEASQTEPLPDTSAGGDAVADGGGEVVVDTGEGAAEGGEEAAEGETPADMPALSADPNVLLGKVNGLSKAGKHKEVVAELQEFEDAVVESNELLAIYVEALIKTDKPDWNTVNRVARVLGSKDNSSSLANYAQGLYWQNTKKPDNSKAVMYFGKAKAAKKPYPGASTAYYIALVKSYWIILLAVVALPIVAVIQKKKKQKAAQAALAETPAAEGPETATAGVDSAARLQELLQTADASANTADVKSAAVQTAPVSAENKAAATADKPAKTDTKSEGQAVAKDASQAVAGAIPGKDAGSTTTTRKVVKVVRKVKAAKPKDSDEVVEEIIEEEPPAKPFVPYRPGQSSAQASPAAAPVSAPPAADYGTITAKRQAEIEKIREMTRPERRPSVQADPELDALWSNLSRKALAGRIGPHARRQDAISAARSSSPSFTPVSGQKDSDIDFNTSDVTIDLSDEALREDLIGKLKMLCISDGELRELFAMKNAAHIPHLIEYILTKPEPLRLSFVAREIGHYGDPAVIDTLASLLYHQDERVALAAIQGLENSKKPAAVLHLCPFLRSEIPLLAQAARTALSNFGAVKILQAFKNLPEHSDEKIREAGVFVLSRMKGNAVEELLKKMLHDDSLEVRTRTILAMSYQKNPVYIDALREFFRIAAESDKAMARKAIVYLQGFVERQK